VIHYFDHVSVGVPEESSHFAILTQTGFPPFIKGDAHAVEIGHPTVPIFYFYCEVVGPVGLRVSLLVKVELRVPQLQKSGALLGPLCVEDLFVPILASGNVTGLNVRVLDTTDPVASLGLKWGDIGVTFRHTSTSRCLIVPRSDVVAP
jgi:hypothetical protein